MRSSLLFIIATMGLNFSVVFSVEKVDPEKVSCPAGPMHTMKSCCRKIVEELWEDLLHQVPAECVEYNRNNPICKDSDNVWCCDRIFRPFHEKISSLGFGVNCIKIRMAPGYCPGNIGSDGSFPGGHNKRSFGKSSCSSSASIDSNYDQPEIASDHPFGDIEIGEISEN